MEGAKFSLSFSKKIEKKVLQPSALRVAPIKEGEAKRKAIESIEGNLIESKEDDSAELVIPLLQNDRAESFKAKTKKLLLEKDATIVKEEEQHDESTVVSLTLDQLAEKALLAEARGEVARPSGDNTAIVQPTPPTQQDNSQSVVKPSTLEDYDEVTIESFGAALMRGMGWKKDEGVGNVKNRRVVAIIDAKSKTFDNSTPGSNTQQKQQDDEALPLVQGCHAYIHAGRNKALYGVVETVEEDHVLVRRAVTGAVLREVPANITVVTAKQYRDSARVINQVMYDEFKNSEVENKKKRSKKRRRENNDEASDNDSSGDNLKNGVDASNTAIAETHAADDSKPSLVKEERLSSSLPSRELQQKDNHASFDTSDTKSENCVKNERRSLSPNDKDCDRNSYKDGLKTAETLDERVSTFANRNKLNDENHSSSKSKRVSNSHMGRAKKYRSGHDTHLRDSPTTKLDNYGNENIESRLLRDDRRYDERENDGRNDVQCHRNKDERTYKKDSRSKMVDDSRYWDYNRKDGSDDRRDREDQRRDKDNDRRGRDGGRHNKDHDRRDKDNDRRDKDDDRRDKDDDRRDKDDDRRDPTYDCRERKNIANDINGDRRHRKNKHIDEETDGNRDVQRRSSKENQKRLTPTAAESISSKYGDCSRSGEAAPWVREGLTVRIISAKAGKYYKQKVRVESVLTAVACECRTDTGNLLTGLPMHYLETVIPKIKPRTVLVLRGNYSGQIGEVLEQHKAEQQASVQLTEDRAVILKLQYEDICQYDQ